MDWAQVCGINRGHSAGRLSLPGDEGLVTSICLAVAIPVAAIDAVVVCSANVGSVAFLSRIQMRRRTSFWVLAVRAVRKEGISATIGARPHRALIITRKEVRKAKIGLRAKPASSQRAAWGEALWARDEIDRFRQTSDRAALQPDFCVLVFSFQGSEQRVRIQSSER